MLSDEEKNLEDFEYAFGLNALSLRLMGIWPADGTGSDKHPEPMIKYLGTNLRVPFMTSTMLLFLLLPQFYALILVIKDLPFVIDNLMTSCAALTSCIKLFFLWRSKKVLEPVIRSVSADWLRPGKQRWEREAMTKQAGRARVFTVSGYLILAGCYCGFAVAPLIGINVRMISNITDYGERYLFVQSYFPYDYSVSPNYELTLLGQLVAGFFVGMSVSIPDNYFAALVFHACGQFEILGVRIEMSLRRSGKVDDSFSLGNLVRRHVHLITNIRAVEDTFSFIVMSQVLCMTVMVCCLGFQILSIFGNSEYKPPLLQVLTLTATLFTLMMHTLVDCFVCEVLAHHSTGIFQSVYKGSWYTMDRQSARDLIPIMVAAKNPLKLTAGKLFGLSLATYCNILKSAAGYISMLLAVSSN